MTAFQWVTLAQTLIMAFASAGVGLLIWGHRSGKWTQQMGASRDRELEQINKRLDHAGEKISELATVVQGLPARMHQEFVPREVFDINEVFTTERREALREEFRREDTKLWEALRAQSGSRH